MSGWRHLIRLPALMSFSLIRFVAKFGTISLMVKIVRFRTLSCLMLAVVILGMAISNFGQTTNPTSQRPRKVFPVEPEPADVLKFDTELVSVDVTATDNQGRPVRNLRQEDFKLYSDGTQQPISFFQ